MKTIKEKQKPNTKREKIKVAGIMTLIVNQDDVIYEKDLRKNTEQIVKAMYKHDPDKTWKKAE